MDFSFFLLLVGEVVYLLASRQMECFYFGGGKGKEVDLSCFHWGSRFDNMAKIVGPGSVLQFSFLGVSPPNNN